MTVLFDLPPIRLVRCLPARCSSKDIDLEELTRLDKKKRRKQKLRAANPWCATIIQILWDVKPGEYMHIDVLTRRKASDLSRPPKFRETLQNCRNAHTEGYEAWEKNGKRQEDNLL
jgi:hypothetical protein